MSKKVDIAKYRDHRVPNAWFLTDFTMEQVEGLIASLHLQLAEAKERLTQAEGLLKECEPMVEYHKVNTRLFGRIEQSIAAENLLARLHAFTTVKGERQ